MAYKMIVKNIGMLATPQGKEAHRGKAQGEICFLKDAWIAVCQEGTIAAVGSGEVTPEMAAQAETVVDAGGHLVTPGLIDAHTHLVFGGWREHELALKLKGVPYLEILAQGGVAGVLLTAGYYQTAVLGK